MPIYKATDGNYDKFKEVVNANDLLDSIDNAPTLDDNEAYDWYFVSYIMNKSIDACSTHVAVTCAALDHGCSVWRMTILLEFRDLLNTWGTTVDAFWLKMKE